MTGKGSQEAPSPEYGSLQELNTSRVILDSVGEGMLSSIVKDFLELLETSVAVYEANGDYALGIFSSKWCRFMDLSSRRLCPTEDNREALTCGKWLCHESCWKAARDCMESAEPVDVECEGGIRLYAVPIFSSGKVVGSINLGYGDPPMDWPTLNTLAEKYGVKASELARCAEDYDHRPPFLIENAKRRMETAARLIGEIVERKHAEEEQRLTEKNLHQILQSIGDAVIATDTQGNVTRMNPVAESLTGWNFQEAQGKPLREVFRIINAYTRKLCTDPVQLVLASGEIQGLANDTVLLAQDGQEYQIADSASPIRDAQGQIEGVVLVFRDVTEKYRQQEALRENKKRFDFALQATNTGLWDWYIQTGETVFTEQWAAMAGYTLDELRPFSIQTWLDLCHPDDLSYSKVLLEQHFRGETEVYECEARMWHKEGFWIWILDRGKVIEWDESGNPLRMLGTHTDITQRKQGEEALQNSENHYRALFETSGTAMFIIEADTTISQVNANFEELSGYTRQEVEGIKSWTELAHSEDVPWMKEYHFLRRQHPDAAPRQYEFRFVDRYGDRADVLLAVDLIQGTSRSIASAINITKRKRDERILQARLRLMESSLTHSLEGILTATLDEAENLTESEVGFYYFLQKDQRTLSLQACSSRTAKICAARGKGMPYDLEQAGVWADCVRRAEPVIHNDYESLFNKKGQPPGHPHIERELVLPVFRKDRIVAMLGVGNKRKNFTHTDVESVSLLANLAWDIIERKQVEEKLKEMSIYDSLTGLYNRNFFEEEMKRLSDGRHHPLGIIVADLDGLKFINDALGHQAGDQMLINTAEILQKHFRSSDIIARIGGDEFAVLLNNTENAVVEQIMQRLVQAIKDCNSSDPQVPLSLSLGYALSEGETPDMHALFREADNRMYRDKIQHEKSARSAILQVLSASMQARDFDTEGHCDRLQELAMSIARSLNLSQDMVNDISLLARFHDLGKVGIPDDILFKQGSLTEEEWLQMRQHCEIGHRIASSVSDLVPIADWILKHHERWDGQGYPLGLPDHEIPLACRILAIADAYDAMTSDRPYRKAMSREEAFAELKSCAGTQFDPELVEKFIEVIKKS